MATLEINSNIKTITSGNAPTTSTLLNGELAFGKVNGVDSLYGNVNGIIVNYTDTPINSTRLPSDLIVDGINTVATRNPITGAWQIDSVGGGGGGGESVSSVIWTGCSDRVSILHPQLANYISGNQMSTVIFEIVAAPRINAWDISTILYSVPFVPYTPYIGVEGIIDTYSAIYGLGGTKYIEPNTVVGTINYGVPPELELFISEGGDPGVEFVLSGTGYYILSVRALTGGI